MAPCVVATLAWWLRRRRAGGKLESEAREISLRFAARYADPSVGSLPTGTADNIFGDIDVVIDHRCCC